MNISPVNHLQTSQSPNFNGNVFVKGSNWPKKLEDKFVNNPALQNVAQKQGYNIFGTVKTRPASMGSPVHIPGEALYKITLSVKKENPSIIDKIKYALGFVPKYNLSKEYHSEEGTEALISIRTNKSLLQKGLNIKAN